MAVSAEWNGNISCK